MRVGAFELERKIGAGGMGEIWLARHVAQGIPAAVKFDLHGVDTTWRDAFLAEVRRIAELDHPHVVHLFDTGITTPAESAATGGAVVEGTPWLAMELARKGSVADEGNTPQTYRDLHHIAHGLLEALAHAHARGQVHRDIKPGNILLAGPRSSMVGVPETLLESRVVLSDFGIGHDRDRPGWMDEQSVGTPRFMAPEQIEANWRDQGPWTDLYQTGIMLWRLATGRYPFEHARAIQLYQAHLFTPVPDFEPIMDVPAGFEGLLRQLLEKDWRKRPRFAADVLSAMEALGDVVPGSSVAEDLILDGEDTPTVVTAPVTAGNTTSHLGPQGGTVLDVGLRGAGLGLWGLRPPPLVQRPVLEDHLWQALIEVKRGGEPRAVVLTGAAGVGKSRHAEWLGLLAHERGVAHVLHAVHHEDSDPEHGIVGMIRRELRLQTLSREDGVERLEARLPLEPALASLLQRWVLGPVEVGERLPEPVEMLAVWRRCLMHWSEDRPLVVVLEDVHFGAVTLRLLNALLARVRRLPVLFVLTVRDDLLVGRPEESKRYGALIQSARVAVEAVEPFGERDSRRLVRKMLGLEGGLAAEVERRTAGNPAFAVQLVNSWVRSGKLVVGPRGFVLEGGLPSALPADLLEVWTARVEELSRLLPQPLMEALEAAAYLGLDVDVDHWLGLGERLGGAFERSWLGDFVAQQVLRADARLEAVHFTHGGLREALIQRTRAGGRNTALANAVAEELLGAGGNPARLAEVLLEAGRPAEAVQPLLDVIEADLSRGDLRSSRWLDTLTEALGTMGAPPEDETWGLLWLNWAWLYRLQGDRERADVLAGRAETAARKYRWKSVLGWALREAGSTALDLSEYEDAIGFFQEAESLLEAAGRTESAAWCRQKLGVAYDFLGDFELAEAAYKSCLFVFDQHPRGWTFAASPWLALAQLEQKRGKLDAAKVYAEEARWRAERTRQHEHLAHIKMIEGEIARQLGDLDGADAAYRASIELYEAFHDSSSVVPTLNLGVVGVLRGEIAETKAMMEAVLSQLAETGRPLFAAYARSVLVACCASQGDLLGFGTHYEALDDFLRESGAVEPDIARLARYAEAHATHEDVRILSRELAERQEARIRGTTG